MPPLKEMEPAITLLWWQLVDPSLGFMTLYYRGLRTREKLCQWILNRLTQPQHSLNMKYCQLWQCSDTSSCVIRSWPRPGAPWPSPACWWRPSSASPSSPPSPGSWTEPTLLQVSDEPINWVNHVKYSYSCGWQTLLKTHQDGLVVMTWLT